MTTGEKRGVKQKQRVRIGGDLSWWKWEQSGETNLSAKLPSFSVTALRKSKITLRFATRVPGPYAKELGSLGATFVTTHLPHCVVPKLDPKDSNYVDSTALQVSCSEWYLSELSP